MKLYDELASWWPLISAPAEYADEAAWFGEVIAESCDSPPRTLLELGSGGGNNAFYLKRNFTMTLVDRSPAMLAVSRALNPECEHIEGDMLTLRLGREFDAVFVHDAIMYMTDENSLRQVLATAFAHCRAGGVAIFAPDFVRETFKPETGHGGHDGEGRAVRYLDWSFDPETNSTTYQVEMVFMMRQHGQPIRVVHDSHTFGLFPRDTWLRLLRETGFTATIRTDPFDREVFVARK